MGTATVNEPDDVSWDWDRIDWAQAEDQVRRLRRRIFAASAAGDLRKVRSLQKLMLRSRANTLVSVRRVTQLNAGRRTAGVDGMVALTSAERGDLARVSHEDASVRQAQPVRRVFIPKSGGALRPLGIPVILDRVLQARVVNALEPEWEARFEPRSYGFRPGRSTQDAIQAIYACVAGPAAKRVWVLDADLKAAFDRIDHDHLLSTLEGFPARGLIAGWLRAGVVDRDGFTATEEGTPQGGCVSPLLLNIALHGMEQAAGVSYSRVGPSGAWTRTGAPMIVRYADDFVALCVSRQQAEQVRDRLDPWLKARGLSFNQDKTSIVSLDQGCDFLGFTIRRFATPRGGKLLIKPSAQAVARLKRRLAEEMLRLRGRPAAQVVRQLNPIVRGWALYYRSAVSSEVFSELDHYLWQLTWKWARFTHPKKPRKWVAARYFGTHHPHRADRWVFCAPTQTFYLHRFSWTRIVRHVMVAGTSSPDDPALQEYWMVRRAKNLSADGRVTFRALVAQRGRCPWCRELLLAADQPPESPEQWRTWLRVTRRALTRNSLQQQAIQGEGSDGQDTVHQLVHIGCRRPTGLA
ncbi:group II intron reverse transcriptase/maturase [Nocardia arizonensis]|uniref:group II intron reverse transcriptase/maturase n=1 Tax=Nocardia arizonensis TaxID=1141647 RepID=UPI001EF6E5A7|nr:group II intron reverse transcriptase/maturase [Nocardia arizonensis]